MLTPPLNSATPISYGTAYFSCVQWPLTFWHWTLVIYRLWHDRTLHQILAKSNNPRLSYWRLNEFPGQFSREQFCQGWFSVMPRWTELYQIWFGRHIDPSNILHQLVLDLRYVAPFRNQSPSKVKFRSVENARLSHNFPQNWLHHFTIRLVQCTWPSQQQLSSC